MLKLNPNCRQAQTGEGSIVQHLAQKLSARHLLKGNLSLVSPLFRLLFNVCCNLHPPLSPLFPRISDEDLHLRHTHQQQEFTTHIGQALSCPPTRAGPPPEEAFTVHVVCSKTRKAFSRPPYECQEQQNPPRSCNGLRRGSLCHVLKVGRPAFF